MAAARWKRNLVVLMAVAAMAATARALPARADETADAEQLLSAFSASCPSQGQWTQNALSQSASLISVLQSIQSDPDCQSLSGALSQLQGLSQRVNQLTSISASGEIQNLQNQQNSLLLQLAGTSDPDLQYDIEASLSTVEESLTEYYTSTNPLQPTAVVETNALEDFTNGSQAALSQLVNNESCILKHPAILSGIASLGATVASATLSAGASLATSAGASLLNTLVEYARQGGLAKKIDKMSGAVSEKAYECALESLSDQWCSAQDAMNIVKLKESSLAANPIPVASQSPAPGPGDDVKPSTPKTPGQFWVGVTLMDEELPVFVNWLNEVRAGNSPTNSAESNRQTTEFTRQSDVQIASAQVSGIFSEALPLFNQAAQSKDVLGEWTEERKAIDTFMSAISGMNAFIPTGISTPNPLFDIYNQSCAPYYLIGIPETSWQSIQEEGACPSIDSFNPFDPTKWPAGLPPFQPNLQSVVAQATAWVAQANQNVMNEMSQVLQADARSIFQDAIDMLQANHNEYSPEAAITAFIAFLKAQHTSMENTTSYYADTIARLTKIKDDIDAVIAHGEDPDNSFSRSMITDVYNQAQLQYGPTLFQDRLQTAIRNSLNELVLSGTGIDTSTGAQLLVSNDLIQQLESVSGTSSFINLTHDIQSAQEVTESALRGFTAAFGGNIAKALKAYDHLAIHDPGSAKYESSKASLCLMLLSVPRWPKEIPRDLCMGTQLTAAIPGGPVSKKIDDSTFDLPHEKRACLYRDYLRESDIYQFYLSTRQAAQ